MILAGPYPERFRRTSTPSVLCWTTQEATRSPGNPQISWLIILFPWFSPSFPIRMTSKRPFQIILRAISPFRIMFKTCFLLNCLDNFGQSHRCPCYSFRRTRRVQTPNKANWGLRLVSERTQARRRLDMVALWWEQPSYWLTFKWGSQKQTESND